MPDDRTAVRQVVLLLADGLRPDLLQSLIDRGELPALQRLLGRDGALRLDLACSVFPSTTGPAHLPFLTGRYPGPCNVPGLRWLDPARYAAPPGSMSRFRSYMGPGALWLGRDMSPDIPTIFDRIPDHACAGGVVRRGVRASRNLTRWSKLREPVISFFTEEWDRLDRRVGEVVGRAVTAGVTFVFGAFYAADSHSHKFGPFDERTAESYRRIDAALAGLANHVARLTPEARPLVMLVSDHGQSATSAHLDLSALVERVVGRCLAHPTVWRGWMNAAGAVMVSGNAMAHVYLRGRRWGDPQVLDDPCPDVARLADALLNEDAIDHVIGRSSTGGAVVLSRRGRARLDPDPGGIAYQPDGGDPFAYPASCHGTHPVRRWLSLTWETDYPDAPVQALQVLASPRAGHLVVTAKPGWDLRARFEKPPHVGSHGSLHRDHMMTPLVTNTTLRDGPHRTVDVFPTILDSLGLMMSAGLDGQSMWPGTTAAP